MSYLAASLAPLRVLDRRIWWLAGARLVVTAGFSMVMPFLSIHLANERQLPAVVVGAIWTVAGVCGAAMQWAAGEVADRLGRRRLMIASLLARAVNLALLGLATEGRWSVMAIGALCVGNSVLRAFFDPVANAAVADLAAPNQRVAAYSLQRVGVNIGWAAGPAVALLAEGRPYSEFFYWGVPMTLLAAVGVARLHDVPDAACVPRGLRLSDLLAYRHDRAFMRVLVATLVFFTLQVQLYAALSIFAARALHLSRGQIGTLYTINGLLVACLQLPAVRTINRLGTRGALVWGSVGYAAAYACVGLTSGYKTLVVCVAAVTLSEIVVAPAQQATVAALAPAGKMGAYAGMFGLAQIAGQSVGPIIGTMAIDAVAPRAAWPLLAIFGVIAALLYRPDPKDAGNHDETTQQGAGVGARSVM